jgi:hypothetical protein
MQEMELATQVVNVKIKAAPQVAIVLQGLVSAVYSLSHLHQPLLVKTVPIFKIQASLLCIQKLQV